MTKPNKSNAGADDQGTLPLIANQLIGNYQLIRLIGTGAMGEVYLARHRQFKDRQYAIKLIRHGVISDEARKRFEREILAMGNLVHPNLVYANDAGMDGDRMYLVMEYVTGHDLQCLIDQHGPFRARFVAEIIRQICVGVSHAHQRGVVHRDIKPANLLLSDDMIVKVMDLGIASLQDGADSRMTTEQSVMGTAPFIAPELWESATNASPSSDVYAIGCTAYCLLTGNPPFAGERYQSLTQVMMAHQRIQPAPLQQLRQDVPDELTRILQRALHKNPAKRFQDAGELAELLAPLCDILPQEIPLLFGTSDHIEAPTLPSVPKPVRVAPRRRWIITAVLLTIAVATPFGVSSLMPSSRNDRGGEQQIAFLPQPWLPANCERASTATLVAVKSIGVDERLWSEILLQPPQLKIDPIPFVLVPQCGTNAPGSFYIMKHKVSAEQFAAFEQFYPDSIDPIAKHKREIESVSRDPSTPVYWVTGMEAAHFADRVCGGKLPETIQWDAAFGLTFDAAAFVSWISNAESYIDRILMGPSQRNLEGLDESRWGCDNMASLGQEYTRFSPDQDLSADRRSRERPLRGDSEYQPGDWADEEVVDTYNRSPESFLFGSRAIDAAAEDISFRVVLEKTTNRL